MANVQEALPGLHDIVAPPAVSWAPGTVGWALVLAVLSALVGWGLVRRHRKNVANRYRVSALRELAAIERSWTDPGSRQGALLAIPTLLKRVALSFADRRQIASLTGEQWLGFLDRAYGGSGFQEGPGRALVSLAYEREPDPVDQESVPALLALVRIWIETHRPESVVVDSNRA
ncbi:MAG: DUF4381 domain-containing protein [Longimicrobiales bacterium]